ncbi:hypothetical protein E2C01_085519 [Portunus trituberculatus]|uniref:Uncharacterized protein n=1 Tax=Portunus trituberculatus TaxID=210409 RepID=A0A5B7JC53_PORTR|nr:hypothetical protein [Portunus trituberculatus]
MAQLQSTYDTRILNSIYTTQVAAEMQREYGSDEVAARWQWDSSNAVWLNWGWTGDGLTADRGLCKSDQNHVDQLISEIIIAGQSTYDFWQHWKFPLAATGIIANRQRITTTIFTPSCHCNTTPSPCNSHPNYLSSLLSHV